MAYSVLQKQYVLPLLLALGPLLLGGFLWFERGQLYHPEMAHEQDPWVSLIGKPLRPHVQEVWFETADHVRLNGWYLPAPAGAPTAVFAHGNAGNLANRYHVVEAFRAHGYGILAFDYRGYGKSEGRPSEKGLYRDMDAASRFLAYQQGVPVEEQIAAGESLGTAVAVEAASRRPYRAVALFAAYTSMPQVAAHVRDTHGLGWLRFVPLTLVMTQRFNALGNIDRVTCPVLILHGEQDALMPTAMPKALYARATTPHKTLLLIPGAGHNEVFFMGQQAFFDALSALLKDARRE